MDTGSSSETRRVERGTVGSGERRRERKRVRTEVREREREREREGKRGSEILSSRSRARCCCLLQNEPGTRETRDSVEGRGNCRRPRPW